LIYGMLHLRCDYMIKIFIQTISVYLFLIWPDNFLPIFEWVSDCCLMPTQQFFSYHGENGLIFNEMITRSALY
jgi:hypothetical protein